MNVETITFIGFFVCKFHYLFQNTADCMSSSIFPDQVYFLFLGLMNWEIVFIKLNTKGG